MKYFQFHLGDWLTSTRTLTATERGVYLDLLCLYYGQCKCICKDDAKRLESAYAPSEKRALDYVLAHFFTEKNGCFFNARCEREIAGIDALSRKRKNAAIARWSRLPEESGTETTDASAYANAMQSCNALGMPSINHKPITNKEREREQPPEPQTPPNTPTHTRRKEFVPKEVQDGSVDPQAWEDFIRVRGKPVSVSFWNGFRAQAALAHLTVPEAVKICAERGWKRIDANWESIQKQESTEERLKRLMGVSDAEQ